MSTDASTPEEVEYHYVLTMQFRDGSIASAEGTLYAGPSATRRDLFAHARQELAGQSSGRCFVLFFTCEPNVL